MPLYMNGDNCSVFSKLKVEGGISGGGSITPDNVPVSTIEVINKTGEVVNEGDKVWLNKNQQTAGSSYNVLGDDYHGQVCGTTNQFILDRSGTFATGANKRYAVSDSSVTQIQTVSGTYNSLKYMGENSMFASNHRIDSHISYSMPNSYQPIANDYVFNYYQSYVYIYKINLETGSILKTWSFYSTSHGSSICQLALINDKLYNLGGAFYGRYYQELTEDSETPNQTSFYLENYEVDLFPLGTTLDNKYVVCMTGSANNITSTTNTLRLVEVINDTYLRVLSQEEMPEDLQEFYSMACNAVFNPYSGMLTVSGYNNQSYAIMEYKNETWNILPIELELYDLNFLGGITISDDKTRLLWSGYRNSSYNRPIIQNLVSTSGFSAVPYKYYNINMNTVIGKAMTSAEPDGTVKVATVL